MEETGAAGRSDGIRTNDDATLGCLTMVGSAALNVYCQNLNFISHIFCIFFMSHVFHLLVHLLSRIYFFEFLNNFSHI